MTAGSQPGQSRGRECWATQGVDTILRTARKDWPCQGDGAATAHHAPACPGTILAGERYVEYMGEGATNWEKVQAAGLILTAAAGPT